MAGPPNPFAGLAQTQAQRNGTTTGHGGGGARGGPSFGRQSPFQAKNLNSNSGAPSGPAPRDTTRPPRGRGRGGVSSGMRSARGRGAGMVNAPRHKHESATNSGSPFAQLKPSNKSSSSPSPSPSPFGGQTSQQQQSPFGSGGGFGSFGSTGFGESGSLVDASRDPRKKTALATNGDTGTAVPTEDASILNSYNERYEQLKIDRAKEREMAIKKGLMADPNQPLSLHQAITPVGTCINMCPEFERVERIVQKMVDKSEKFLHPSTNSLQYMETKMLKRFRRSAAGYDEQLPSDIRTPNTLLQTVNYLMRHVIGGPEPLGLIHKFVWDRTRSVRNDFSVQQLTQENDVRMAVTCLERIARFHIVSLHLLSSPANEEPFDRHQEREQLNNTMLSLMYYYDDNRGRISFPNEDEFRAYYIIFSIHDQRPDLEARVQKWPAELRNSTRVQAALELFAASGNTWDYQGTLDSRRPNAIAQGFYTRFFELIDSPSVSYLMACVAEIYFNHVRQTAVRSIWKGYCRSPASQQHKNEEWTIGELTTVLFFDDDEQTIKFCDEQGLSFAENANGDLYLNWGTRPVDSVDFQPSSEHSFSEKYVELKRAGRSLVAVILGLSVQEAARLGMIDSSVLPERSLALPAPEPSVSNDADNALFVSDDENEIPAPSVQIHAPETTAHNDRPPKPAPVFQNGFAQLGNAPPAGQPGQAPVFQTPESNKPFPSLFNGNDNMGSATTAPPSTAPNPFASVSSPFASLQTTSASQAPGPFSLTSPSPEKDTAQSSFAFGSNSNATNNTTSASTTPQFKFPSASPSASQPPTSSPFGIPAASNPLQNTINRTTETTAGQPPKSLFESIKPPTFSANTNPLFNFSSQSTTPKEADAQASQTDVSKETPLFAPKQNEAIPSIFSFPSTTSTTTPSSSIFTPKDTTASVPKPDITDKTAVAEPIETEQKPVEPAPASDPEHVPLTSEVDTQPEPPTATSPVAITALVEQEPAAVTEEDTSTSTEPAAGEEPSTTSDTTEQRTSWLEALKEAAKKRREEHSTGRKRVHDEPRPAEPSHKAPKKPKPEAPNPRKTSMALSSIKPLPTLPILEQVKSSTKRKSTEELPQESTKPKYNQVDEDELLLSAARIAAESLRSGPRLSDGLSVNYTDAPRSSFSPRSSLSSSLPPLSGSQSPQYHVNGHDLALAPDTDLGLGRTLSRTEQRLRLTGGKGLAYKPLEFASEKKKRNSSEDSR